MTRSSLDTPMMRQFLAIKARHPDAIVFYRMGDFYEMFLHDAELAAPLLDIALTTRDRGKRDPVPMCGVPVHAADGHVKRLAELGHRVAICEQVEDPRQTGGRLVKREVVEVVTPGLVGDPEGIDGTRELALVGLHPAAAGEALGLAVLDASTGDLRATEIEDGALPGVLLQELGRIDPREILLPAGAAPELGELLARARPDTPRTEVDAESFDPARAPARPHGLAAADASPGARAAAALLAYVAAHQPFALAQVARLRRYELGRSMLVDATTRQHLELFRNAEDGTRRGTLIERLDRTRTPLGARRLARWLAYPLLEPSAIAARQEALAWFAERDRPRARVREALRPVRDLERLLARATRPSSTPRDLAALRASLEALPGVIEALGADGGAGLWADDSWPAALSRPRAVPELATLLREALVDEPPVLLRGSRGAADTGYIRRGFHGELDALRDAVHKGREWIAGLEARERERTGVAKLRIVHHPVHGYSIELSKANLSRAPEDYERKQTLANSERFTTPELREMEQGLLGSADRAAALERELVDTLRQALREHAAAVGEAAGAVAELDAVASLAEVSRSEGWVRPEVDDSRRLEIRAGRHPVVEAVLAAAGEDFVPNDTGLDTEDTQILVLTGPNMSGKSTYLRQVALCVLLAQMGCWVPAAAARVGVVDRVFTRVGASDRLSRGESTFMVEMREVAEILGQASPRSLVILDEIGRGTSTFDGLSIAWAVAEYLHQTPGLRARTLFATHYHELADLSRTEERVKNAHFEAREWGEEVVFLRRLAAGSANRSYGIQVARLAGLPEPVIARAREILANLEGGELDERGRPRLAGPGPSASDQLPLFGGDAARPGERRALEELRRTDPDRITPVEALALLARLRAGLDEEGS